MQISNQDRRLTYLNAVDACKKIGLSTDKAQPAYGFLRLETPIIDGQTSYSFPVIEQTSYNGVPQQPTEKRLQLQDAFVVGAKGFFLYFLNKVTNKPESNLLTYIGRWNVPAGFALGNVVWLPSGTPENTISGLNNAFWQDGFMKYTMNYDVLIPRYDMLQHLYIPPTQATQFTPQPLVAPYDATLSYQYPTTQDQRDGLADGWIPMEPNIVLSGAKNSEVIYNLPYPISFADLDWTNPNFASGQLEARMVVMYRGILLQNATSVQ